ncbi:MAG: hypothetical protein H0T71_17155 [Acidobacteria bacterium]|nr:hypothetical protein [Acidobacteriota bacterium]
MHELIISACLVFSVAVSAAQDHHGQMTARGAHAMGFDQEKTTHHFYLHEGGGAIEVTVKDRKDLANLEAIRLHLPQIAKMFAAGDFSMPHFVHAPNVPGTEGMTRLRDRIAYAYEELPGGGRVRVTTRHARALQAVHEFLKYQITDHKTGDPLHVTRVP